MLDGWSVAVSLSCMVNEPSDAGRTVTSAVGCQIAKSSLSSSEQDWNATAEDMRPRAQIVSLILFIVDLLCSSLY